MSEVMLHVSQSDVSLLSMLFRSLNTPSGAARVDPEVDESGPVDPTPKTSVELMAAGLSVRLLQNVQGREKVLVRLDIGTQELHLVQEEELQLLRYSLQPLGVEKDSKTPDQFLHLFGQKKHPKNTQTPTHMTLTKGQRSVSSFMSRCDMWNQIHCFLTNINHKVKEEGLSLVLNITTFFGAGTSE